MAKKETAEEKLIKIIEANKKAKGDAPASPSAMALPAGRARLRFFITVQQINAVLVAAVLAGLLFLGYQIQSGMSLLNDEVSISVDARSPKGAEEALLPPVKNIAYYLEKVSVRNIFQPFEKKVPGEQVKPGEIALAARMAKYKLVGVAWLDVPESATVMLEDLATRETRFLKEGDKIEDVKVKAIFTDRVVFSYANEEMTIKL